MTYQDHKLKLLYNRLRSWEIELETRGSMAHIAPKAITEIREKIKDRERWLEQVTDAMKRQGIA